MFKNLRHALNSKGITMKSYAEFLDVTEKTLQNKMNGVTDFSFPEVEKTLRILFPEYNLSYLFARDGEHQSVS